ncbi:hypothetical protein KO465_05005 [Candidatus Micrarchaeota archaeon]|nr:hypothetical protein [Candidatus Micrarchaeota archaeon]
MNEHIENAFQSTSRVLFGKNLESFEEYENWLVDGSVRVKKLKSAISKDEIYYYDADSYNRDSCKVWRKTMRGMENVLITINESHKKAQESIPVKKMENACLKEFPKLIKKIRYVSIDKDSGPNIGINEVFYYIKSVHCFRSCYCLKSKYCVYSNFPENSEYMFGSNIVTDSKFCFKCYDSSKLIRCFEVGESDNCRDCYFCYNCENLDNCMFCFNATSKHYAIANVELGKEEYMKVKERIIREIWCRLNENKKLEFNLYNLGCL